MSKKSEEPKSPSTLSRKTSSRRRRSFYVIALLLGLAPLVLLEAGLRLFGVGEDAAKTDLHAGFGNVAPLFVLDEDGGNFTTGIGREQFFVTESFEAKKPDKQFRIFCLGGSTVQGRPYLPDTAFGKWLELELNAIDDSRDYRVVNCGGISYASYRLRPLVKEIVNYEPDLIVVATGHNEFLEDKTYAEMKTRSDARIWLENSAKSLRSVMLLRKLVGGAPRVEPTAETTVSAETLDTRLDDPSGYASYRRDEEWQDSVCNQFERSVNSIVDNCQSASVPLMLVQMGANLRDCPPFKSEHRAELTVDKEQRWQEIFDAAGLVDDTDAETGLDLYLQAMKIDDQYALLHFRIARCYDAIGQFENSRQYYQSALDLDVCPLRKSTRLSQLLADIAGRKNVPLVDASSAVSQSSPDSICGYEAYIDHVHPTIGAHQAIAHRISEAAVAEQVVAANSKLTDNERRLLYRDYIATDLPPSYYSNGRRRIGWLEGWAQRTRLADETIPVDNRGRVALAIRNIDLHRFMDAEVNISDTLDADKGSAMTFVRVALSFFKQGRNFEARWLLRDLESRSLSEPFSDAISLGLLVLALDSNNAAAENQLEKTESAVWPDILASDRSGWSQAIPNLNNLIQGLFE